MPNIAIALGTFDGVHIGHAAVLNKTVGCKRIALTFNTPPKSKGNVNLLMTSQDKINYLVKMGIEPIVLDFEKIKNLSPLEFLSSIKDKYHPQVIASGFNFRFGKNASGDKEFLADFCRKNNIEYRYAEAVMLDESPVSSTSIRGHIAAGEVKQASKMLDRYFSYEADVVHGDERGRTIGFPTINQVYPGELVIPRFGVYASFTVIDDRVYQSVTDIGRRPTFKTDYIISETNIIDYNSNAYEKKARIFLVDFIRDETRFNSLEELKNAIERDKSMAKSLLMNKKAPDC